MLTQEAVFRDPDLPAPAGGSMIEQDDNRFWCNGPSVRMIVFNGKPGQSREILAIPGTYQDAQ